MSTDREAILDRIVRWEEARAHGQAPAPEDFCRDRPELLSAFLNEVAKLEQVAWLDRPIAGLAATTSISASPGADPASSSSPTAAAAALPLLMAGRYRLDLLVGRGGFARVYRGFDTWLERYVAVKVPTMDRPVTSPELDLCRLEARKVARLKHPNIVPVHDVGQDGGTCFIVSEWIDGMNLAERIAADRPSFCKSATIAAEVAEALAHAHERGYVHRDIKPANLLLDRQGHAYLTDFGIAAVEEELLGEVKPAGTLPYMAPEQLAGEPGAVDHRADLYALGVVLYELLTNKRPFQGDSAAELRKAILSGTPRPPRSIDPDVPEELERICLRCLERNPEDRYARADLLAADLRAASAPLSGTADLSGSQGAEHPKGET